jgi:RNA polymerase sigma factor (TIGR02999 family)
MDLDLDAPPFLAATWPLWSTGGPDLDTAEPAEGEADQLLNALGYRAGDALRSKAIYDQLRQIAHSHRIRWVGDPTVCTTALVHEAYLKLARSPLRFRSRAHFLATSSRAMRQVLVTYAEARCAQKRGGGDRALPLEEGCVSGLSDEDAAEITAIGEALRRLARYDERGARVVECRFFAGLTVEETAEALDLSPATVTRTWRSIRTWLYRELHGELHGEAVA